MDDNCLQLNWKQKMLLTLLKFLNNERCSRLRVFKMAFLLGENICFYDFVPYKFGPYSFEMDKDLRIFNNHGLINMEGDKIHINHHVIKSLSIKTDTDKEDKIREIINEFENMNEKNLLKYVYENHPFYTQNSLLIKQKRTKNQTAPISIYTIGYQNLSIDLFISILIKKGIKVVLDVRNKPFSHKYGFNYHWLKKYLKKFGLEYVNIPQLGIEEKYRNTLSYSELWNHYSISLKKRKDYINEAIDKVLKKPTVLMCYEMNFDDCHRLRLAKAIQALVNLPIINFETKVKKWKKLES